MTYVGPLEQSFEADLSESLRRLGIPDWLAVVADPGRARAALTLRIPEFASGELTLRECEIEQVRMKDDAWTVRYRLAIEGPEAGSERSCQLRGDLVAPSRAEPGEVSGSGFGTDGWRCYIPELRLDLGLEPQGRDVGLPSLSLPLERTLKELIRSSLAAGTPQAVGELAGYIEKVGVGLAQLHTCG